MSYAGRQNKKNLVKHLKNAREQNLVAKIKGTTLEIEGHVYSANDLKVLEETSEDNGKSDDSADENQEEKSHSPLQQSGSFGSQQKTTITRKRNRTLYSPKVNDQEKRNLRKRQL
ncbi:hypothetical protein JTB14_022081 [Gonioctena quinquepunctata]|nr:hypothetical protein JTB14_022081 [Gonioctena quinquepunctata]